MMHGLGDVKKPLPESAAIVEELVHQQMVSFVLQALDVAQMRNPLASSQRLDPEDCLFLMRKNKVKLRRLYRYALVRDMKEKANSSSFDPDEESKDADASSKGKLKACIKNFVKSIEVPGQSILSEEMENPDEEGGDAVKLERLRRAEFQSR